MRFRYLLPLLAIVSATYSCKTSKLPKTDSVASSVTLDTVTVKPKDIRNYRASATKLVDLVHTKLQVSFDWQKQHMAGKANITMTPHFYPQDSVTLDAKGFDLNKVALVQNGGMTDLKYTYDSTQIKITLPKAYTNKDTFELFIDYVSKPNDLKEGGSAAITSDKGLYFINPLGKEPNKPKQIWTQGETESNSCWFPTIDKPNQRMTEEIYMTVADSFQTLSNGLLVDSTKNADGTRTDHWKMSLPHPPYLVMMEVGQFSITRDTWRGKPVEYYVEPKYGPYARDIFGQAPNMIEFFSNTLGFDYPWEKYSNIVARDYVSGAMENTTANLYFSEIQRNPRELKDKNFEYIVAHELFHQWFGDLLTTESWSNLTLNEGFANYGEYLWIDHKYGRYEAEHHRKGEKDGYIAEAMMGQEPLIRFYYDDRESMFDATSYNKGGLVLNMLRNYVGDTAFFASLKLYLQTNKYSAVEYTQLRLAFEKVTGEDLNWFFNEWYLTPGHPILTIGYDYNDSTQEETVKLSQKASKEDGYIYKLPMKIDIYQDGKVQHHSIVLDQAKQEFTFKVTGKPNLVNVDADKTLLAIFKDSKGLDEYSFQYFNAPQYLDKQEALAYMIKHQSEKQARDVMLAALTDTFWAIRQQVAGGIKFEGDSSYTAEVKMALINMAMHDQKSSVAAEAVNTLADLKDKSMADRYIGLIKDDRSYVETAAALSALFELGTDISYEQAKPFMNEENADIAAAVGKIVAKKAKPEDQAYFERTIAQIDGYGKYMLLTNYGDFLKEQDERPIRNGVKTLELYARSGDPWWLRYSGAKGIYDIIKATEDKITKKKDEIKATATGSNPSLNADIERLQRLQDDLQTTLDDIKKNETNKNLISRYKNLK